MNKKEISILGCGWLGLPLAESFIEPGWKVKGSTTTPEKLESLCAKKILSFLIDLNSAESLFASSDFFNSEILIINVPPKRNSGNSYADQIKKLKQVLQNSAVKKVLFISSTSVYLPSPEIITEDSALELEQVSELITAEKLIAAPDNHWQTTILRFSGLFGPNRQPGKFLAGKTNLPEPDSPINLIHLSDCVGIIQEIVNQDKWNEVFNACADEHPTRKKFYTKAAQKLNLPLPAFDKENAITKPGKTISNQKIKAALNYTFKFPDPLAAI